MYVFQNVVGPYPAFFKEKSFKCHVNNYTRLVLVFCSIQGRRTLDASFYTDSDHDSDSDRVSSTCVQPFLLCNFVSSRVKKCVVNILVLYVVCGMRVWTATVPLRSHPLLQ